MERTMHQVTVAFRAARFFVAAPGLVAGVVPYLLTGWGAKVKWPAHGLWIALGAMVIAVGLASLVESFVRFVSRGRGTPAPSAPPVELVVSGQYRFVRNPMYVAVVGIILGQALVLGRVLLVAYGAAVWFMFHVRVLTYEEPRLKRQFGAAYEAYCSRVRRWLPRSPSWKDA
jgi:protein-S-isoprenylcysteine O-methyltransferase Ste14